jgi:hypothetical protein
MKELKTGASLVLLFSMPILEITVTEFPIIGVPEKTGTDVPAGTKMEALLPEVVAAWDNAAALPDPAVVSPSSDEHLR